MAEEGKGIEYDFAAHERPLFDAWKSAGYFQRSKGRGDYADQPYTIVIPPPSTLTSCGKESLTFL